ncbi:MAG: class B sortase, partial [Eubacterium sp.]|nr:class B sortase [Eubacterium sp.]
DGNTVIYGHNMKNGHVFGTLDLYEDPAYFKAHREIHFDTIYETGIYEAVAVVKTRIRNENEQGFRYYQFFQYDNQEQFLQCADFVNENQMFDTGSRLRYGDQILMLSTCEYSQENGRLVIVARKAGDMESQENF